jgi:hypothetical protein
VAAGAYEAKRVAGVIRRTVRWNRNGYNDGIWRAIRRSPGLGTPGRPPRFVPVLPKPGLTERLTAPRSNPTRFHRPSHAQSPTVEHYCPSHGLLWFEELSHPLRKGGVSTSLRTNGTSKCVLVA